MIKIKNIFLLFCISQILLTSMFIVCMDNPQVKKYIIQSCTDITYAGPSLQKKQENCGCRILSLNGEKICSKLNEPMCGLKVVEDNNHERIHFAPLMTMLGTNVGDQIGFLDAEKKKAVFYGKELENSFNIKLFNFKISPDADDVYNNRAELQNAKVIQFKNDGSMDHGEHGYYFPDVNYNMPLGDRDRYGE